MKSVTGVNRRMRAVRSAMLTLCLASLGAVPMLAQDSSAPPPPQGEMGQPGGRPSPDQMLDRQMEHLTRALDLTSDQATQIRPMLKDQMSKMMALRQDTQIAPEEKHAQMIKLHTDSESKIRAVLSSEQQTKFDALMAQQQQHMGRGHGGFGGQGGGQDGQAPPPPPPQE